MSDIPQAIVTYIYLDFGFSPTVGLEIDYSLSTLLAETARTPRRIALYTDRPQRYADHPVSTVDIGGSFAAFSLGRKYLYRVKLCVLVDACERWGGMCAYLDSDTFVEPGFAATVASLPEKAAAMHRFEGTDPLPAAAGSMTELPSGFTYNYDAELSFAYNSGAVLFHARSHAAVLKDALALFDAFTVAGIQERTLEQIAISEAFRVNRVPIFEMHPFVVHYWSGAKKRFMHAKIAARAGAFAPRALPVSRPAIVLTRGRVRLRERAIAFKRGAVRILKSEKRVRAGLAHAKPGETS